MLIVASERWSPGMAWVPDGELPGPAENAPSPRTG
jgi:hypothetical protein